MYTYAGHPSAIDTIANTVHSFPHPSALNIAGANRGNSKPIPTLSWCVSVNMSANSANTNIELSATNRFIVGLGLREQGDYMVGNSKCPTFGKKISLISAERDSSAQER